ncbi:hypothetical protein [Algoriphagus namhaensis]
MKIWKSILILILLGLLALGGFWIFTQYFSTKKVNNLSLISQEAIFAFESYDAAQTWNSLVNSDSYPLLQNFPAFRTLSEQLGALDSLTGSQGVIAKELSGTQTTISLHPVGKESFDLLFMINLREGKARELIDIIEARLQNGERFQPRTYTDIEILELFDGKNDRKWSIAFLEDLVLISASSFLVEEAIRYYENGDLLNYQSLFDQKTLNEESEGRLLLSSQGVANLLRGVQGQSTDATIRKFELYQQGLALDLDLSANSLSFSGPIVIGDEVDFTPSIEANLNELLDIIPSSTASLMQINLEGIYETQKLQNRAFTARETLSAQIGVELLSKGFLDTFYGDLYFLRLEKIGPITENMSLITRSSNPEAALELLKNYQNQDGDIVSDFYRGREIILVNEQDFPAHLFEGKFQGFNQSWITAVGNHLIFTNNQQSMKLMLDEMANGDTWGKTSRPHPMKTELSASSGFSKLILTDKIWDYWTGSATPAWSSFFQRYASSFFQFHGVSFRINQFPDRTLATLSFPYASGQVAKSVPESNGLIALEPAQTVNLGTTLTFGPKAITNYQDRTEDLVVQDANNQLILLNSAGEQVYKVGLDGPIISDAYQVDYYKNGKLQLLLATPNSIYGIDRLGNPLPGYPLSIPGETLQALNLVDYDNTKAYRYFVSTADGDLYLLDKSGEILEGWDPNSIGAKSIGAPRHVRVPRKGDYMLAFSLPGNLHLFNRRGERQVPQPIKLGEGFATPLVVFNNPKSNSMELVNISENGEIVRANFDGEITYVNQLVKEDRDSKFFVVSDQLENEFLIVSKQFNELKIRNSQEEEIFSINSSTEAFEVQFFNFGASRRIIAITDLVQEFAYLYDFDGNLLTALPLESSGPLEVSFDASGQQYLIRCIAGSQLMEYALAY